MDLQPPRLPRTSFGTSVAAVALLLSACYQDPNAQIASNESSDPTSPSSAPASSVFAPPQPASPGPADAGHALQSLLNMFANPIIQFGSVPRPRQCVPGQSAAGTVMVCRLCIKVLGLKSKVDTISDLDLEMLDFSVPFKLAISYDQPDIMPAPGSPGVWVVDQPNPQVTGRPNTFSYQTRVVAPVRPQDITAIGLYVYQDIGTVDVGLRPMGGHSPGLQYIHMLESGRDMANEIVQHGIPPSVGSSLGECPAS